MRFYFIRDFGGDFVWANYYEEAFDFLKNQKLQEKLVV